MFSRLAKRVRRQSMQPGTPSPSPAAPAPPLPGPGPGPSSSSSAQVAELPPPLPLCPPRQVVDCAPDLFQWSTLDTPFPSVAFGGYRKYYQSREAAKLSSLPSNGNNLNYDHNRPIQVDYYYRNHRVFTLSPLPPPPPPPLPPPLPPRRADPTLLRRSVSTPPFDTSTMKKLESIRPTVISFDVKPTTIPEAEAEAEAEAKTPSSSPLKKTRRYSLTAVASEKVSALSNRWKRRTYVPPLPPPPPQAVPSAITTFDRVGTPSTPSLDTPTSSTTTTTDSRPISSPESSASAPSFFFSPLILRKSESESESELVSDSRFPCYPETTIMPIGQPRGRGQVVVEDDIFPVSNLNVKVERGGERWREKRDSSLSFWTARSEFSSEQCQA